MSSSAEQLQARGCCLFALALVAARGALAADVVVDVRDTHGTPLIEAAVFAEPVGGEVPKPAGPMKATIDQVNKTFVPRVSVVRAGTTVAFPNSDNIRHSIYSFSPAKTFATKLYSGKEAAPVVFDKTGLVVMGCNIHDQMAAWVIIVDTPWFGTSDKSGTVTLKNLPPGDYRISSWYPSPTYEPVVTEIHVTEGAPVHKEVKLDVQP